MIDLFLQMEVEKHAAQERQQKLAEQMRGLPAEALRKLASGDLMKVAEDRGESWLERFTGTPLLQSAIALENEEIALEMEKNQHDMQQPPPMADYWQRIEQIRLKKKMLDLQRVQQEAGGEAATPEAAAAGQAATTQPAADQPEMGAVGAGKMASTAWQRQIAAGNITSKEVVDRVSGHGGLTDWINFKSRSAPEVTRAVRGSMASTRVPVWGSTVGNPISRKSFAAFTQPTSGAVAGGRWANVARQPSSVAPRDPQDATALRINQNMDRRLAGYGGYVPPVQDADRPNVRFTQGPPRKVASIDDFADQMGRELARNDFRMSTERQMLDKMASTAWQRQIAAGNITSRDVVSRLRPADRSAISGIASTSAGSNEVLRRVRSTMRDASVPATRGRGTVPSFAAGVDNKLFGRSAQAIGGPRPVDSQDSTALAINANMDNKFRLGAGPAAEMSNSRFTQYPQNFVRSYTKTASIDDFADQMGRELARNDFRMSTERQMLDKMAAAAGRIMTKMPKQANLLAAASGLMRNPKVQQAALGGAINAFQAPKGERVKAFAAGAATTAVGNMGQGAQQPAATPATPAVPSANQIATTPPQKLALDMNMVREFAKHHPHAAAGAAGAAAGGLWRAMNRERDPMTGQEEGIIEAVGRGATAGGALGLGASAAAKAMAHHSPMESLSGDAEHGWSSIKKLLESKEKPAAEAASAAS